MFIYLFIFKCYTSGGLLVLPELSSPSLLYPSPTTALIQILTIYLLCRYVFLYPPQLSYFMLTTLMSWWSHIFFYTSLAFLNAVPWCFITITNFLNDVQLSYFHSEFKLQYLQNTLDFCPLRLSLFMLLISSLSSIHLSPSPLSTLTGSVSQRKTSFDSSSANGWGLLQTINLLACRLGDRDDEGEEGGSGTPSPTAISQTSSRS